MCAFVEGDPDEIGGCFWLPQTEKGLPLFMVHFTRLPAREPIQKNLHIHEILPGNFNLSVAFDTPEGRTLACAAARTVTGGTGALRRMKLTGRGFETLVSLKRRMLPALVEELRELGETGNKMAEQIEKKLRSKRSRSA